MIESVSAANISTPIKTQKKPQASISVKSNKESKSSPYFDSFVKHAKKSTPTLLILTGVWTAIDKTSRNIPIKMLGLFLRFLFCSGSDTPFNLTLTLS